MFAPSFQLSCERSELPLRTQDWPLETQQWLTRYRRYQKGPLPLKELLLDPGMAWAPGQEEGPVVVDRLTMSPLSGLATLKEARRRGETSIEGWAGLAPEDLWRPLGEPYQEAFQQGKWALDWVLLESLDELEGAGPNWLHVMDTFLSKLPQRALALNFANERGVTVLGGLLQRLGRCENQNERQLLAEGGAWLLGHGASARLASVFPQQAHYRLPWQAMLETFLPSVEILAPQHPIPSSLLHAFLESDLDWSDRRVSKPVGAWLERWVPNQNPERDAAITRLKMVWMERTLPQAPSRPGPRL